MEEAAEPVVKGPRFQLWIGSNVALCKSVEPPSIMMAIGLKKGVGGK